MRVRGGQLALQRVAIADNTDCIQGFSVEGNRDGAFGLSDEPVGYPAD